MIPKKIIRKSAGALKTKRVAELIDYILAPVDKNHEEKLLHFGARGFVFEEQALQRQEMLSLVSSHSRSPNPVMHYLFSWKENEQPSKEQMEDLLDIFIEETGLSNNQIVWGAHQNTKNIHIHLAVNKIDLDTEKITRINNNLDIEVLHKVVARAEHKQGWESTPNSRYFCDEQGNILRTRLQKNGEKLKQNVKDFEISTGEKSLTKKLQEDVSLLMKSAQSWIEVHEHLDALGVGFIKKGSGAVFKINENFVKASSVSREFSLKKMEKRFGRFVEKAQTHPPLIVNKAEEKMDDFLEHKQKKIGEKNEKHKRNGKQVRTYQQQSFNSFGILSTGRLFRMSSCPLVHRKQGGLYRHRRQNKGRKQNRRWEIEGLLPNFRRALGKIDNFLRWRGAWAISRINLKLWLKFQQTKLRLYQQKVVRRLQKKNGLIASSNSTLSSPSLKFAEWLKMNDFSKQLDEWRYERNKNYITNEHTKDILEVKKHELLDEKLSDLVCAGWSKISLYGNDFFKMLAVKLSFKHKLEITNPELQEMIAQEKDVTRIADMDEVKAFRLYHEAVQADRYRVTCMKIKEDGTKLAFILDKQYQVNGFTPEQLEERLKEMLKIQSKGNNIYLTPISDKKHHILVDDMDSNKVSEFLADGYSPAALIESSPNNYQAIISIPKLGTAYDRVVGNKVAERLNKKYGDEKLSGCIHPHRVPSFENLKAKHRKENGTYPKVQLLKSEQVECSKTFRLSQQIKDEHVVSEKRRLAKPKEFTGDTKQSSPVSSNTAYFHHLDNIKQHLDVQDKSRVDAMIALRMRATGHSQGSIEQTILECAPTWRSQNERKNWNDYAKRTANYAFSFAGDRDLERNQKYIEHWQKVEGGAEKSRKRMK